MPENYDLARSFYFMSKNGKLFIVFLQLKPIFHATQNYWLWILLRHFTQRYQHVGIFCIR